MTQALGLSDMGHPKIGSKILPMSVWSGLVVALWSTSDPRQRARPGGNSAGGVLRRQGGGVDIKQVVGARSVERFDLAVIAVGVFRIGGFSA
ncbi:MAG: hypothetical protein AAGF79_20345 [Pseudomonadota bacterium]